MVVFCGSPASSLCPSPPPSVRPLLPLSVPSSLAPEPPRPHAGCRSAFSDKLASSEPAAPPVTRLASPPKPREAAGSGQTLPGSQMRACRPGSGKDPGEAPQASGFLVGRVLGCEPWGVREPRALDGASWRLQGGSLTDVLAISVCPVAGRPRPCAPGRPSLALRAIPGLPPSLKGGSQTWGPLCALSKRLHGTGSAGKPCCRPSVLVKRSEGLSERRTEAGVPSGPSPGATGAAGNRHLMPPEFRKAPRDGPSLLGLWSWGPRGQPGLLAVQEPHPGGGSHLASLTPPSPSRSRSPLAAAQPGRPIPRPVVPSARLPRC